LRLSLPKMLRRRGLLKKLRNKGKLNSWKQRDWQKKLD
jgi:hypothetical protein